MKTKLLLFFSLALISINDLNGQNIWNYCLDWSPGDPISNLINGESLNQAPNIQQIKTCAGATIDFSARFVDLDDAACPRGTFKKQFPESNYSIRFESSVDHAVFQNGATVLPKIGVQILQASNPFCPGETVDVFITLAASLTIMPDWNGENITVTVIVTDLGAPLPDCHTGDSLDEEFRYSWTISQADEIPEGLIRVTNVPMDNNWVNYIPPQYNQGGVAFEYRGLAGQAPIYEGVIVKEEFSTLPAGGIFTMDDLTIPWKNNYPNIMTADEAAQMIFLPGNPNSFPLDGNNEFEDFHGGWAMMNINTITQIFTIEAIENKRVGYKYDQNYSSCLNNIGSAEIWRRIDRNRNVELKKNHDL